MTETSIQDLFMLGMKREIKPLLPIKKGGLAFDLGASGTKVAEGAIPLGLPDWRFPLHPIPAEDESVDTIHAYHFLEHLAGEDAIALLVEAQRVLKKGGVFQFCIPYYKSNIASHDLTHKSFWTETTFQNLFRNQFYDPTAGSVAEWKLSIHAVFIMGIVERNIALLGQLVKE